MRGWVNNHCPKKNRCFDENYFDVIDMPNKAYFLGLIYADGWVSVHSRQNSTKMAYEFGLQLQRNDRYVLEWLNTEIGGVHSIKDMGKDSVIINNTHSSHTYSSVLRVYSEHFVRSLMNHNIMPNKTYSDNYPTVQDALFCHFLRGYFDGDGCVCANRRGRPQVHFTAFGCSFLSCIRNRLLELYGIESTLYAENERKSRLMIFRNKDVERFADIVYDAPCDVKMLRKYSKFMTLLGLAT